MYCFSCPGLVPTADGLPLYTHQFCGLHCHAATFEPAHPCLFLEDTSTRHVAYRQPAPVIHFIKVKQAEDL